MKKARKSPLKLLVATFFIINCIIWMFLYHRYCFLHSSDDSLGGGNFNSKNVATPTIIFYNRIPKTGSTTFVNAVAYDLSSKNGFHVAYMNFTKMKGHKYPNKIDQVLLIRNLTSWLTEKPAFYHGHTAFIDFSKFAHKNLVYINIVRQPFDRFLSNYYFSRNGDDYRVGLKRNKAGNNETIDECFQRKGKDCDPSNFWLQIPYFCGTAHFCSEPGNKMALEAAKRNLLDHYLLVGMTEKMEEMVALLEQLLPEFFSGAFEHFRSLNETRSHLRHTIKKIRPSDEVEHSLKSSKYYQMELEFYNFVAAEFNSIWNHARDKEGHFLVNQFHYEKIR